MDFCRFTSAQLSSLLQQLSVFLHCSLQSLFSACCLCIVPGRHDLCPLVYFCNICVYCQNTSSLELKSRFIYFSNSQARLSLKWKDLLILGFRLLVRQNKRLTVSCWTNCVVRSLNTRADLAMTSQQDNFFITEK